MAVRQARELARTGASAEEIYAELSVQFEGLRSSRLREFAELERYSQDRLDILAGLNWGQFQDLLAVTGCPPGSTGFRINVTVRGLDPETGIERTRNESVTVEGARTVTQLLTSAIGQVVNASQESRSPIEGPERITREYIAQNTTFNYIDCY